LTTSDPDHALMLRVAEGDIRAYGDLVSKHLNLCVRVAERMLGNRQDAEDIAQDACIKIWNEASRWQPRAKFSTWLYRIVFNACIDCRRKRLPFVDAEIAEFHDPRPASEELLITAQQSLRVRAALQHLPVRQRAAIILSYYESLSNQNAADVMGLQLGAFQQLLFRAKQSLKQDLKQEQMELKDGTSK